MLYETNVDGPNCQLQMSSHGEPRSDSRTSFMPNVDDDALRSLPKPGEKKYWQTRAALLFGINVASRNDEVAARNQFEHTGRSLHEQVCLPCCLELGLGRGTSMHV
jgi:hypothetical protein